jgi:hypothetical protein
MEHDTAVQKLLKAIRSDEDNCFDSGRLNNLTDIGLTIVAVLGSLAATVLVSTGVNHAVVASIAAIPAACTTLQHVVDFRGRSSWYFQHSAGLKALGLSLEYAANPDLEQFAKRRGELELEAEKRWSQIGRGGGVNRRRGAL